jgi:DNA-binding transcriptional LysR family regulator
MSNLRNFDLNLLLAFDVLMQERNVTRAAERMFVTQSAMSHTLHRLRQQLDDPLLVKTPSGMQPTERAMALVAPVRSLLLEMERLLEPPQAFDPVSSQRRFTIAATDYMEFLLLPDLSRLIEQVAPGIDIHVKRTESAFPLTQLENGSLDVVLGFASILEPPAQLCCEHLFVDLMACVVRDDHPKILQAPSLEEYLSAAHMLISRTGSQVGVIDAKLAEMGLERRINLIVPHFIGTVDRGGNRHDFVLTLSIGRAIPETGGAEDLAGTARSAELRFGDDLASVAGKGSGPLLAARAD